MRAIHRRVHGHRLQQRRAICFRCCVRGLLQLTLLLLKGKLRFLRSGRQWQCEPTRRLVVKQHVSHRLLVPAAVQCAHNDLDGDVADDEGALEEDEGSARADEHELPVDAELELKHDRLQQKAEDDDADVRQVTLAALQEVCRA